MPKTEIFEGKTTNEAIEKGLKELKVSRDKVDIKVLEEDKRSFFSILAPRVVKVEMTIKEVKQQERRPVHKEREKVEINESEKENATKIVENFVKEFLGTLPQK